MNDTTPDVEARYRAMLLARPPAERFLMGIMMFDAVRAVVLASFPADIAPAEKRRRLFERFYGDLPPERVPPELQAQKA